MRRKEKGVHADKTHEKSGREDYLYPSHRVYFPRFGERSTRPRSTIFVKSYAQLEADIKRLATRFGSIDEQWVIKMSLHMLANIPLYEFNDVFESYMAIIKRRNIEEKREKRKDEPLSTTGKIMNAGGIDWLIWSKASGRSMKKTAERIDVPPSSIGYFLKSRYNTSWTELGE